MGRPPLGTGHSRPASAPPRTPLGVVRCLEQPAREDEVHLRSRQLSGELCRSPADPAKQAGAPCHQLALLSLLASVLPPRRLSAASRLRLGCLSAPCPAHPSSGEIWGDMGRYGEIWGDEPCPARPSSARRARGLRSPRRRCSNRGAPSAAPAARPSESGRASQTCRWRCCCRCCCRCCWRCCFRRRRPPPTPRRSSRARAAGCAPVRHVQNTSRTRPRHVEDTSGTRPGTLSRGGRRPPAGCPSRRRGRRAPAARAAGTRCPTPSNQPRTHGERFAGRETSRDLESVACLDIEGVSSWAMSHGRLFVRRRDACRVPRRGRPPRGTPPDRSCKL